MAEIIYKEEDINMILKALNSITVKGIENARFLAFVDEKLRVDGRSVDDEKEEGK